MSADTRPAATPVKVARMPFGRWMRTVGWRHLVMVAAVLFALFPISYIINLAFSQGSTLDVRLPVGVGGRRRRFSASCRLPPYDTSNFDAVLTNDQRPFPVWFQNTVIIATVVAFASVFMGASAAFAFSRMRFRGRRAGLTSLVLIQMFPAILAITAIFLLLSEIREHVPEHRPGHDLGPDPGLPGRDAWA